MNYIIDANNLAGSMGILQDKGFDKQLIRKIEDWLGDKQKTVVLVFDSLDPVGDRISKGFLEVIYSPRDGYLKTADDKIVELFQAWSDMDSEKRFHSQYSYNLIKRLVKDDLTFVTNDLDLKVRIKDIIETIDENISAMSNEDFIAMIERSEYQEDEGGENRDLSEEEVEDINNELLKIWKEDK